MTDLEFRPLRAADLPEAAALCQREIAYLPFSEAILKDRILDDPDFDPDLNPTVWQGDRLVGLACGAPPSEELETAGGVKLFAVASDMRRQGISTRLFDHIEDRLAGLGAGESVAIIAGNNRFMQGLDLRYTEALCFLEARGYERAGRRHGHGRGPAEHAAGHRRDRSGVGARPRLAGAAGDDGRLPEGMGLRGARVRVSERPGHGPGRAALGLPGDLGPEAGPDHPLDGREGRASFAASR